jgi:hypothetical protein
MIRFLPTRAIACQRCANEGAIIVSEPISFSSTRDTLLAALLLNMLLPPRTLSMTVSCSCCSNHGHRAVVDSVLGVLWAALTPQQVPTSPLMREMASTAEVHAASSVYAGARHGDAFYGEFATKQDLDSEPQDVQPIAMPVQSRHDLLTAMQGAILCLLRVYRLPDFPNSAEAHSCRGHEAFFLSCQCALSAKMLALSLAKRLPRGQVRDRSACLYAYARR